MARFTWGQISYLKALEEHFDVRVAWSGEAGKGVAENGLREGLRGSSVGSIRDGGAGEVRARLDHAISEWRPGVVHVMFYNHDELTLIVRELVSEDAMLVYECRDPQTTLSGAGPESRIWALEEDALRASDAQILVTEALRSYLERSHGLDLGSSSLIVPHGFAREMIAPPSAKLSARDGRTHIALVGTADDAPDHGRWYGDIIEALVSAGLVVHSHFFDEDDIEGISLEPYRALARRLDDYHYHRRVSYRHGTELSELISRYDLMGVFYELGATHHNESATLAVSLPTKAVCGWLPGGIPVVCLSHCRGIVEWIDELDIGFVVDGVDEVGRVAADRAAIARATERCLACRDRFTNEASAARIREFVGPRLSSRVRGSEPAAG